MGDGLGNWLPNSTDIAGQSATAWASGMAARENAMLFVVSSLPPFTGIDWNIFLKIDKIIIHDDNHNEVLDWDWSS